MALESANDLLIFAETQTLEHWNAHREPLLLSILGSKVSMLNAAYRNIFLDQSFRQFLETNKAERFKIVQHGSQKAKVGLIPANESFHFPDLTPEPSNIGNATEPALNRPKRSVRSKYVVQNFLELVSELDSEDISKVVIPVDVLAKLIQLR